MYREVILDQLKYLFSESECERMNKNLELKIQVKYNEVSGDLQNYIQKYILKKTPELLTYH